MTWYSGMDEREDAMVDRSAEESVDGEEEEKDDMVDILSIRSCKMGWLWWISLDPYALVFIEGEYNKMLQPNGNYLMTSGRQIFGVGSEGSQVSEINLTWTQGMRF
jgi:hypothetical protein